MKLKGQFKQVLPMVFALTMMVSVAIAQSSKKPNAPQTRATNNTAQSKSTVYNKVDVVPTFPGGINAFGKFLSTNIKYPADDRQKNRMGKVFAQFIVERDGSLTNVKIMRSPSKTMGDEAIRVLSNSPNWKPGTIKGKPVRALYTVPINFVLSAT